jgi:antitoxin component YwqK of YwqJK toxin-antitoxin module
MRQFLFLILAIYSLSCSKEVEKVITTYEDGKPELILIYPNEKDSLNYKKKVLYKSGKLNYLGQVIGGKKNGTWTWWYENGTRKDQCTYWEGFYTDTVFHWYESGKLKQIVVPVPNKIPDGHCKACNGTVVEYFENGKIKEKYTSNSGVFHGAYERFDENGGWRVGVYKNGLLEGPSSEHNIDSVGNVIIVVGQYENNKETTKRLGIGSGLTRIVYYTRPCIMKTALPRDSKGPTI